MCANHIICPHHGFAIAGRIRQILKAFWDRAGPVPSVRKVSKGNVPCNMSPFGARGLMIAISAATSGGK
jgi:hypothetical protein